MFKWKWTYIPIDKRVDEQVIRSIRGPFGVFNIVRYTNKRRRASSPSAPERLYVTHRLIFIDTFGIFYRPYERFFLSDAYSIQALYKVAEKYARSLPICLTHDDCCGITKAHHALSRACFASEVEKAFYGRRLK